MKGEISRAETTALTVDIDRITFPAGVESLGEKANFLHAYSIEASKRSAAAAILAGWVLSMARETCAHGMWLAWLEKNVAFNARTAQNYMSLYAQTVGAARAALRRPIPLSVMPTMAELTAAAHDLDGKSLSALYKSTRLISAETGWGGKREGAGRKAKDAVAELDEIRQSEALAWAAARGALDSLSRLDGDGAFAHLSDAHLGELAGALSGLLRTVQGVIQDRVSGE